MHAAAAALGAALAPGTSRLLRSDASPLVPAGFVPAGFRFLDSPGFGIRVIIPSDLATAHARELARRPGPIDVFADVARRVGNPTGGHPSPGDTDILEVCEDGTCLGVLRVGTDEVPTTARLTDAVSTLALADVRLCQTLTALGPATTLRGTTRPAGGEVAVPGYVLWTGTDRGVLSIQVTAESDEVADAFYGIVLRTLQPLPARP